MLCGSPGSPFHLWMCGRQTSSRCHLTPRPSHTSRTLTRLIQRVTDGATDRPEDRSLMYLSSEHILQSWQTLVASLYASTDASGYLRAQWVVVVLQASDRPRHLNPSCNAVAISPRNGRQELDYDSAAPWAQVSMLEGAVRQQDFQQALPQDKESLIVTYWLPPLPSPPPPPPPSPLLSSLQESAGSIMCACVASSFVFPELLHLCDPPHRGDIERRHELDWHPDKTQHDGPFFKKSGNNIVGFLWEHC